MINFFLKYRGTTPGQLARRALNDIMRAAYQQLGLYWVLHFRAKHFTNAGATEYGYAPREGERGRPGKLGFKRSYTGRKLRIAGHTRPLVSGRDDPKNKPSSEAMTKRSATVQAFSANKRSRVEVKMTAPRLNYTRGAINMRRELTTISRPEQTILQRLLNRYLDSRFRNLNTTTSAAA
jgi:hypothetical protein